MFFETGEVEMPDNFFLPDMGKAPKNWIDYYLSKCCVNSVVEHLGTFKAFAPGGSEHKHVVKRNLFMLTKIY